MTPLELAVEIVGWTGAALILGAYGLLSAGRTTGSSAIYQGMNVVGAAGFVVNSAWHGALPSAILNVIWCAIGIAVLTRITVQARSGAEN